VTENVSFVPVDFERISIASALSQAGLDLDAATYFSMLGVSQYLTEGALEQTLRFILGRPTGSEIVFSFVASDAVLPSDDIVFAKALTAQAAAIGEPWLSRFLPDQLTSKLTTMGFTKVFHLTPEEANSRYFHNRRDGLNASILQQMMRATV
jgi:O-methyltransferase involved in polyketide biosynthesis